MYISIVGFFSVPISSTESLGDFIAPLRDKLTICRKNSGPNLTGKVCRTKGCTLRGIHPVFYLARSDVHTAKESLEKSFEARFHSVLIDPVDKDICQMECVTQVLAVRAISFVVISNYYLFDLLRDNRLWR
ncbi:hypothetical protein ATE59_14200 [Sphingopyxis sp. A083]|nr:hypothetical protein ATE59_14200 [Sphingopyxis sp. A083]